MDKTKAYMQYPSAARKKALAVVASGKSMKAAAGVVGASVATVCGWVHAAGGAKKLRENRQQVKQIASEEVAAGPGVFYEENSQSEKPEELEKLPIVERALRVAPGHLSPWRDIAHDGCPVGLGLSPSAAEKILTSVAMGTPPEIACEGVGLASCTWADWQLSSQAGDLKLQEWVSLIRIAASDAVRMLQQHAIEGMAESKGAMWTLQRLRPEIFDPKPPQETQENKSGLRDLPQETIDAILSKRYGMQQKRDSTECIDLSEIGVVTEEATKQ